MLQLVVGERISDLPQERQEELAGRLDGVEDAGEVRQIAAEYLSSTRTLDLFGDVALAEFVRSLQKGMASLAGRLDRVGPTIASKHLQALKQSKQMIDQLIAAAENAATGGMPS
jgi:hypothetical protein